MLFPDLDYSNASSFNTSRLSFDSSKLRLLFPTEMLTDPEFENSSRIRCLSLDFSIDFQLDLDSNLVKAELSGLRVSSQK